MTPARKSDKVAVPSRERDLPPGRSQRYSLNPKLQTLQRNELLTIKCRVPSDNSFRAASQGSQSCMRTRVLAGAVPETGRRSGCGCESCPERTPSSLPARDCGCCRGAAAMSFCDVGGVL